MQIDAQTAGDILTLRVKEERLDAAVATAFKDSVRSALGAGGRTIILDMSRVGFMDSSGLGAMIAVLKAIPAGRTLQLRGLSPNVARVFQLTRMDQVFTILDDQDGRAAPAPRRPLPPLDP